jgi:hypothetical protein
MAKRVATRPKARKSKRETNRQRATREDEQRTTELLAGVLATVICKKGHVPLPTERLIRIIKEVRGKLLVVLRPNATYFMGSPLDSANLPETGLESERLKETYTAIGREFCEFKGNVSGFLRLVADRIDGKRTYSPGGIWYDGAIEKAYLGACISGFENCPDLDASSPIIPSFAKFRKVFWEQNPKLQGASDRSLQRSLKRLGCPLSPVKRGRPKGK